MSTPDERIAVFQDTLNWIDIPIMRLMLNCALLDLQRWKKQRNGSRSR